MTAPDHVIKPLKKPLARTGASIHGITSLPENPTQNAIVKSFNGRDELLNETLFSSLSHARAMLSIWRADYNRARPHSNLGWKTPADFASTFTPRRALALRSAKSSAPPPIAPPVHKNIQTATSELAAG